MLLLLEVVVLVVVDVAGVLVEETEEEGFIGDALIVKLLKVLLAPLLLLLVALEVLEAAEDISFSLFSYITSVGCVCSCLLDGWIPLPRIYLSGKLKVLRLIIILLNGSGPWRQNVKL